MPPSRIPGSVSAVVDRFFAHLADEQADFLEGLYIVGSVALDDYQFGRSDIDFVAVTRGTLRDADLAALERVHASMRSVDLPCFDGFYIEAARLAEPPNSSLAAAYVQDGMFNVGPCFEVNPATWHLWARRGITVKGPSPAELSLVIDPAELRRFEVTNLQDYWLGWIDKTHAALVDRADETHFSARLLAWGVLGVTRIACTLATERVVSKTEAGEWALQAAKADDISVIKTAILARQGKVTQVSVGQLRSALAVMRATVMRALNPTPPS